MKRFLAILLTVFMLVSLLPAAVFADEGIVEERSETVEEVKEEVEEVIEETPAEEPEETVDELVPEAVETEPETSELEEEVLENEPEVTYVARIGETQYETLAAAVAAAQNGDTIELLADIVITENAGVTIPAGLTVTLDLKGKNLSNDISDAAESQVILNNGFLTIKDTVGGGSISTLSSPDAVGNWNSTPRRNYGTYTINNAGTLTILSGTIVSTPAGGIAYAINNGSSATLNVNGGSIETLGAVEAIRMVVYSSSATCTVNITAGSISASGVVWIQADGANVKGVLNVSGGQLNTTEGYRIIGFEADDPGTTLNNVKVNVSGGSFTKGGGTGYPFETENFQGATATFDPSYIELTGGTFHMNAYNDTINGKVGTLDDLCAEGYMVYENDPSEGLYTVKAAPQVNYVAQIGETRYETLAEAFTAASAAGTATVQLIADFNVEFTGNYITVASGKDITLDLNGHNVISGTTSTSGTSLIKVAAGGKLTIEDKSADHDGSITNGAEPTWIYDGSGNYAGSYASNLVTNEGTFVMESGTIDNIAGGSAAYAIDAASGSTTTINGGLVKAFNTAVRIASAYGGSGKAVITMNDGEIYGYVGIWAQVGGVAAGIEVNVNGGQILARDASGAISNYAIYDQGDAATYAGPVSYNITGGTISGVYAFYTAGANVDISGGTFSGKTCIYAGYKAKNAVTAEISGGTFTGPAYIYAGYNSSNANVVEVSGGTFENLLYIYDYAVLVSDISITGGQFKDIYALYSYNGSWYYGYQILSGGIFEDDNYADRSSVILAGKTFGLNKDVETMDDYPYAIVTPVVRLSYIYTGESGYVDMGSLAEAVAVANTYQNDYGCTDLVATMLADETITETAGIEIPAGLELTLDLAGFTVSQEVPTTVDKMASQLILNKGSLTVKGGTLSADYKGVQGAYAEGHCVILNQGGSLTIENGTIAMTTARVNGGLLWAIDSTGGSVLIKGGTFTSNYQAVRAYSNGSASSLVIEDGTFTCPKSVLCIDARTTAPELALEIKGGTFTSTENKTPVYFDLWKQNIAITNVSVNIAGGKFAGSGSVMSYGDDTGSLAKALPGFVNGGIFSFAVPADEIAEGYACMANDDSATKTAYPYMVAVPPVVIEVKPAEVEDKTVDESVTVEEAAANKTEVVNEIASNDNILVPEATNIQEVVKVEETALAEGEVEKTSELKIELVSVAAKKETNENTQNEEIITNSVIYDVKPVFITTLEDGTTTENVIDNDDLEEILGTNTITFRLPVPTSMTGSFVTVKHYPDGESTPDWSRVYEIQGTAPDRYVEISVSSFSDYELQQDSRIDFFVQNEDTNAYETTLSSGLTNAKAGETLILLKDIETADEPYVKSKVSIDLNGHKLYAESLALFGGNVFDSTAARTGRLYVDQDSYSSSYKDANGVMPVWTGDSYRFVVVEKVKAVKLTAMQPGTSQTCEMIYQPKLTASDWQIVYDALKTGAIDGTDLDFMVTYNYSIGGVDRGNIDVHFSNSIVKTYAKQMAGGANNGLVLTLKGKNVTSISEFLTMKYGDAHEYFRAISNTVLDSLN